jgi:hypothetical protein
MLECGENAACPSGFECQAASQLCVPAGTSTPCLERVSTPNLPGGPPEADADVAGDGAVGGGALPDSSAGTSGTGGAGGEPGLDAGAAGTPTDPVPGALGIESVSSGTESACTDAELRRTLRASGGVGPYLWHLIQAPPGVELSVGDGTEREVIGVPSEPGTLLVEVEDASGQRVQSEPLVVYESPRILTQSLPVVCAGAGYAAPLLAEGGQQEQYVWSARVRAESGASSSRSASCSP